MPVALEIIAGLVAVECALLAVFFMPKLTRWVDDRTPAAMVAVTAGVILLLAAAALHVGIVVHTAQGHEPSWASVAANAVQLAAATLFIVLGWRYLDFHLEPKQAQDLRNRLRESEEGFRQVFRDSPVAKGLSGTSGPWTQVNGAFCELLGYSEGELLTLDYRAITHPVDVDADIKAREALIEGRAESDQREKRLISKNGDVVWVQRTLFSIRDEEGNLSHFYIQMLDVTAR